MVFSPSNYDRFILFFLLLFAIKQMKQEKKKIYVWTKSQDNQQELTSRGAFTPP